MADESRRQRLPLQRTGLWLLAPAVVALRLPTLSEPRWYSDEGTFTTVAWLLGSGRRLYRDAFDNSPPGIYWIYRGLLAAGGTASHVAVQAALLLAGMVSVLLTYLIATNAFRDPTNPQPVSKPVAWRTTTDSGSR